MPGYMHTSLYMRAHTRMVLNGYMRAYTRILGSPDERRLVNGEKQLKNTPPPLRPGCEKQPFATVKIPGRRNYFVNRCPKHTCLQEYVIFC